MNDFTRRGLIAGASVAAAGALPAEAAAPPKGKQAPSIYRYKIGSFEVTALYDGVWYRPIDEKFVRQADYADVRREMSNAFMPEEKLATPFTTVLVNTGKKLILLDTGTGGQIAVDRRLVQRQPESRRHRSEDDRPDRDLAFPPRPHQRHQDQGQRADLSRMPRSWCPRRSGSSGPTTRTCARRPTGLKIVFHNVRRIFADIAKDVTHYRPGKEVAPGIEAVDAAGHTPGHTVFALQSGKEQLMVLSDTTQHPALFARHPEWQAQFDIDGPLAVTTRKKLLDRAAADRTLVTGYHFPFPACGHIVKTATGYEHVPLLWNIAV